MEELDEIRKKKLADLEKELAQQNEAQEQIDNIENFAKKFLTKEALERFGNLKQAHPEKALQFAYAISQGVKSGMIKGLVDDTLMKEVLIQMQPHKRDTIIRRR